RLIRTGMLVTAIALLVAAAAVFFFSPVVLSYGNWQSRRPSLALKAWLAALIGGLLLSAAAVIALIAGALDAESTGTGSQAWVPGRAGWGPGCAAGVVLARVRSASAASGRGVRAAADSLPSTWPHGCIGASFRVVSADDAAPRSCSWAG